MNTTDFEMKDIYRTYITLQDDSGLDGYTVNQFSTVSDGAGVSMGFRVARQGFGIDYYINHAINDTVPTPGVGFANLAYHSTNKFHYIDNTAAQHFLATEEYVDAAVSGAIGGFTPGSMLFADSGGDIGQDNTNLYYDSLTKKIALGTTSLIGDLTIIKANNAAGVGYYVRNSGNNALSDSYFQATNANQSQTIRMVAPNAAASANAYIGTSTNNALGLRANNIEYLTVLPTGNIGIGTLAPSTLLHVQGFTDNPDAQLLLTALFTASDTHVAGISISGYDDGTNISAHLLTSSDTLDRVYFGTGTNHPLTIQIASADVAVFQTDGSLELLSNGIKTSDPGGGAEIWELGAILPCLSFIDNPDEVIQVRIGGPAGQVKYINSVTPTFA